YRCLTADAGLSSAQPAVNDALRLQAMRDEMRGNWDERTGQFLWVDGIRVPVIIDDTIPEVAISNGAFCSTIYVVPLTVIGGVGSLYMGVFKYHAPAGGGGGARR